MSRRLALLFSIILACLALMAAAMPVMAQTATPRPTITRPPSRTPSLTATVVPSLTPTYTPSASPTTTTTPTITATATLTATLGVTLTGNITASATATVTLSAEEIKARTSIQLKWIDFLITLPPIAVSIVLALIANRKKEEGKGESGTALTILSPIVGISFFILLALIFVLPNRIVVNSQPILSQETQSNRPAQTADQPSTPNQQITQELEQLQTRITAMESQDNESSAQATTLPPAIEEVRVNDSGLSWQEVILISGVTVSLLAISVPIARWFNDRLRTRTEMRQYTLSEIVRRLDELSHHTMRFIQNHPDQLPMLERTMEELRNASSELQILIEGQQHHLYYYRLEREALADARRLVEYV